MLYRPDREACNRCRGGIALSTMVFIALFSVVMVLALARLADRTSRTTKTTIDSATGKSISDGGIQLGLASLAHRVSMVEERMISGYPDPLDRDQTRLIGDEVLKVYNEDAPGRFWVDTLFFGDALLPPGETDFEAVEDDQVAEYHIISDPHRVVVRLHYANGEGTGVGSFFDGGDDYNNVWLRYSYEIISQDMETGKITRVQSYARGSDDAYNTIQINLFRTLSRYNLFAEFNAFPPDDIDDDEYNPALLNTADEVDRKRIIWDSANYEGKVYSKHTLYLTGSPSRSRFLDEITISTMSAFPTAESLIRDSPPSSGEGWRHYCDDLNDFDNPEEFNSGGNCVPEDVPLPFVFLPESSDPTNDLNPPQWQPDEVLEMPGNLEEEAQRRIAFYGFRTADAIPADAFYHGAQFEVPKKNSNEVVESTITVYVRGDAHLTFEVIERGDDDDPNDTHYTIEFTEEGIERTETFEHKVSELQFPTLLFYIDGALHVEGKISDRSKVTIASRDDLTIANNVEYEDGPDDDTVIGLVSWNAHVLIARDIPSEDGTLVDLNVHAVVMAANGGFGAECYVCAHCGDGDCNRTFYGYPDMSKGKVWHTGSLIRKYGLPTQAVVSVETVIPGEDGEESIVTVNVIRGWNIEMIYDDALESLKAPPYFPGNGPYEMGSVRYARVIDLFRVLRGKGSFVIESETAFNYIP